MPKVDEFQIQRALCIWLDGQWDKERGIWKVAPAILPDVVWWHTPNGGSRRDGFEGKRLKESGVKPGIYDLSFLHLSLFYVLELKDETGELSDEQLVMWTRYERAGAAGIAWANSLAAARAQLFSWRLTRIC